MYCISRPLVIFLPWVVSHSQRGKRYVWAGYARLKKLAYTGLCWWYICMIMRMATAHNLHGSNDNDRALLLYSSQLALTLRLLPFLLLWYAHHFVICGAICEKKLLVTLSGDWMITYVCVACSEIPAIDCFWWWIQFSYRPSFFNSCYYIIYQSAGIECTRSVPECAHLEKNSPWPPKTPTQSFGKKCWKWH